MILSTYSANASFRKRQTSRKREKKYCCHFCACQQAQRTRLQPRLGMEERRGREGKGGGKSRGGVSEEREGRGWERWGWQQPGPSGAGTRRGNSPPGTNRPSRHPPPHHHHQRIFSIPFLAQFSTSEGHYRNVDPEQGEGEGCCQVETNIFLSRLHF